MAVWGRFYRGGGGGVSGEGGGGWCGVCWGAFGGGLRSEGVR